MHASSPKAERPKSPFTAAPSLPCLFFSSRSTPPRLPFLLPIAPFSLPLHCRAADHLRPSITPSPSAPSNAATELASHPGAAPWCSIAAPSLAGPPSPSTRPPCLLATSRLHKPPRSCSPFRLSSDLLSPPAAPRHILRHYHQNPSVNLGVNPLELLASASSFAPAETATAVVLLQPGEHPSNFFCVEHPLTSLVIYVQFKPPSPFPSVAASEHPPRCSWRVSPAHLGYSPLSASTPFLQLDDDDSKCN